MTFSGGLYYRALLNHREISIVLSRLIMICPRAFFTALTYSLMVNIASNWNKRP